ncbi:MAG: GNAT family N-acetyltransferase [Halobacteriota archaeon]
MGLLRPPDWSYREDGLVVTTVDPAASELAMAELTALMERAWRDDDQELGERNLIPSHVFDGQAKQGNLLVTTDERTGDLVGFVNFVTPVEGPGRDHWVYSHTVGVDPGWKDCGVGTVSKRAQAAYLDEFGYRGMAWTFDPKQGRNARLNFHKLGCVNLEFRPNQYPELPGLPADRFVPMLDFESARYREVIDRGELEPIAYDEVVHAIVLDDDHRLDEERSAVALGGDEVEGGTIPDDCPLLVDNPWDFDALGADDDPSPPQWEIHEAHRELFGAVLDSPAGEGSHVVVDYLSPAEVRTRTGCDSVHPGYVLLPRSSVAGDLPGSTGATTW